MTNAPPVPVPSLTPPAEVMLPSVNDRKLPTGLRVLSMHRPGVPLVEIRLRIPFPSREPRRDAQNRLLAATILAGTGTRTRDELAGRMQELGATLSAGVDADQLLISGVVLVEYLGDLLSLLSEALVNATYRESEVDAERNRLLQRLSMARSRASVRASETLRRHLYGDHPYGRHLPDLDDVASVSAEELRALHHRRVVPAGSVLILVGALDAGCSAEICGRALAGWARVGVAEEPIPDVPGLVADPSLLVHRQGSVQSSIRIGGRALQRDHPKYPALQLANLIYGGYFSSRLVSNIREDKGYSYSPRSRIDHGPAGATLIVEADVATEVTAPALLEMWHELGRLSTMRPTDQELADVRQYAVGTLAMSIATQSGLASTLAALIGVGLDLAWIRDHPRMLATVTASDIYDIGVHILAPCRLAAVVIGDATETAEPLSAFGPWEVRP